MRQAKFILALVVLVGLGAAFYYFSTKGTRDAAKSAAVVEEQKAYGETLFEEAPADSQAVLDTLRIH